LLSRLSVLIEELEGRLPALMSLDPLAQVREMPIGSMLLRSVRSVVNVTLQFLMVFFFAVLFLVEKYFIPRKLLRAFGPDRASRVPHILRHIDQSLRRYIGVKTLVSLVVALLSTGALLLFKVEFAVIWGVLTFLLNFIPSIGSITATILPFLFSFAQYGGTATPFWILLVLNSLQFTTGNMLDPMLMGTTLDLSLWVVFLSLLFWGWLWGPLGILLAVPMTTSIRIVLRNIPITARYATLLGKARLRERRLLRFLTRGFRGR
jgi:predicted PurR-regulated permease PerM